MNGPTPTILATFNDVACTSPIATTATDPRLIPGNSGRWSLRIGWATFAWLGASAGKRLRSHGEKAPARKRTDARGMRCSRRVYARAEPADISIDGRSRENEAAHKASPMAACKQCVAHAAASVVGRLEFANRHQEHEGREGQRAKHGQRHRKAVRHQGVIIEKPAEMMLRPSELNSKMPRSPGLGRTQYPSCIRPLKNED